MSSLCRPTALDALVTAGMIRGASHSRPQACAQHSQDQASLYGPLAIQLSIVQDLMHSLCMFMALPPHLHDLVSDALLMPRQAM